MKSLRVVYMGTPDFAVLPLKKIIKSNHEVLAVVTAPDKPAGRGRKLRPSAVKEFAVEQGLQVLQPIKLRDDTFIQQLKALQPDVIVVVAFRMLPEVVWQIPKIGTFNLHASLLPQYRGAAPINWAIINGETETGVTTFFINEDIDTGAILLQERQPIGNGETAGTLHDKLMLLGADLVVKTLNGLADEGLTPKPQPVEEELKAAPKIFKDDCKIDWNKNGLEIERLIRGLSPYPGAFTELLNDSGAEVLKIGMAQFRNSKTSQPAGAIYMQGKELHAATKDGYLEVTKIQPQGKRMMSHQDFINGMTDKSAILHCR